MTDVLAIIILLILFGCEHKISYSVDGNPHTIIINPETYQSNVGKSK